MSNDRTLGPWSLSKYGTWQRRRTYSPLMFVEMLSGRAMWDVYGPGMEHRHGEAPDLATAQAQADDAARALGWTLTDAWDCAACGWHGPEHEPEPPPIVPSRIEWASDAFKR